MLSLIFRTPPPPVPPELLYPWSSTTPEVSSPVPPPAPGSATGKKRSRGSGISRRRQPAAKPKFSASEMEVPSVNPKFSLDEINVPDNNSWTFATETGDSTEPWISGTRAEDFSDQEISATGNSTLKPPGSSSTVSSRDRAPLKRKYQRSATHKPTPPRESKIKTNRTYDSDSGQYRSLNIAELK